MLNLYVPMPMPKKGIFPIAIIPKDVSNTSDLLLCFSSEYYAAGRTCIEVTYGITDRVVTINQFGDVIQDLKMGWEGLPNSLGS